MSGKTEEATVRREKGFIAYYRRRPLTMGEKLNKICLEGFAKAVVEDLYASNRAYEYFRGVYTHYQSLPRQWGHPSG